MSRWFLAVLILVGSWAFFMYRAFEEAPGKREDSLGPDYDDDSGEPIERDKR